MPNVFWYLCIAAVGVILIIFTIVKKKNLLDYLSFFLTVAGLFYLCEVVILFVFQGYVYKPGLFKDPVAESVFGHLVCNGFFWGGFSFLVAAFSLRFYWSILISGLFVLTEVLFLKLHIYTHHWWRLYMTGLSAFIYLIFSKAWFSLLKKKKYASLRYFTFYFIACLLLLGPSVVLLIMDKQHFGIGLVKNFYRDDILFDAPYHLLLSFVFIFFVNFLKHPLWKTAPFFAVLLSDFLMQYFHILTFQNGWNLFYLTLVRYLGVGLYIILEKHALNLKYYYEV